MKISNFAWIMITPTLLLSACSPAPNEPAENPVESEIIIQECDSARFENLVGQPEEILKTTDTPENTRIITPGTMVTKDYRVERMNIDVDEGCIITKVWCG